MAKRVLIVDDAAFMRMMLKDIITKAGYEVVGEATNGREAVEKYKELKPDIVTMDITMPGTFKRPRPKVTSPMTKAAITTPGMEPEPPRMLTPPSTTMVTTSSSMPEAMEGRVEPSREVRQTEASPAIRPVKRNRMNFTRSTRMPEKVAAVALLPMA